MRFDVIPLVSLTWRCVMKIWINRAGQNIGTFTLEEVQRGLNQGQFVPTDLAWQEGMETWKPLAEFAGLQMPGPQGNLLHSLRAFPLSPDVPPPLTSGHFGDG